MKVSSISSSITKAAKGFKAARHQRQLDRLVNLSEVKDVDSFNKLRTAQSGIANYAKSKNVTVSIEQLGDPVDTPMIIGVKTKNGKTCSTELTPPITGVLKVELPKTETMKNATTEDGFLRRIYRAISEMTEFVSR